MPDRIKNIEEMTNKIIEYIQVTSVELSGDEILDKCEELFHIIINCAFD